MTEAGINIVMKIVAGIAGIIATSPLGDSGVPGQPLLDASRNARPGHDLLIEDASGQALGRLRSGAPVPVELEQLPAHFIDAVIAAEDERFLEHPGVDPAAVTAALRDTLTGRLRGGSGLAQQTVKNTLVGNEASLRRKAVEAMLAVRLRHNAGEQEVLRRYLQAAWFGRGVTGAMEAPSVWFGKDWSEVTLAEAATLAAMLKGPALYDPARFPDRVRPRRDAIIRIMESSGWVSAEAAEAARSEPVTAIPAPPLGSSFPWIISAARAEIGQLEPALPRSRTARTTIEKDWQEIAGRVLAETLRKSSPAIQPRMLGGTDLAAIRAIVEDDDPSNDRLPSSLHLDLPPGSPYRSTLILGGTPGHWDVLSSTGIEKDVSIEDPHADWKPEAGSLVAALPVTEEESSNSSSRRKLEVRLGTAVEGAVVILDPRSGALLASIGGVDAGLSAFDRTRGTRQPGSAIKPFLYLAALERGFYPAAPVEDIERTYRSGGQAWRPRNYDGRQMGRIPMFQALERSSNLASVWVAKEIGIEEMAFRAEAAGVYPPGGMVRVLPSALGASDSTLLDLTRGYAVFANGGFAVKPHSLGSLTGKNGTVHFRDASDGPAVASPQAIDELLGMLRGVVSRGTASVALSRHPVMLAGKTGTTQDHRDAWFVGLTPHLAIGVWIGRDNSKPMPGTMAGGSHAAPIAGDILRQALEAGLIGEDGLRDNAAPRVTWPPVLHQASDPPRVPAAAPIDAPFETPGPGIPPASADEALREIPDYEKGPANQNADLLDFTF